MEHRFEWNADRIRFFCDAAKHSAYHEALAKLLKPALRPTDRVLDAGCGLGYLSEALVPYCSSVTAVDIDRNAIAALKARTERVTALCADAHTIQTAYDVIVCCYFGATAEALSVYEQTRSDRLILVKRRFAARRFSKGQPEHERTANEAAKLLDESGFRYRTQDVSLPFDQPFRSVDDAVRFFSLYRSGSVDRKEVERLCIKTGDTEFPYRLPVQNEMRIFYVSRMNDTVTV